jgi:hypothetical protein
MEKMLEQLYQTFKVRERSGPGGKTFKYVPSADIIDRMNRVFEGKWSVRIMNHEIVDDNVVVMVTVQINIDGNIYEQQGFASHQIQRFTGGDNKGKMIDVGNTFRSATSKAIKTAVARWGVGLYLEEDDEVVDRTQTQMPNFPSFPNSSPSDNVFFPSSLPTTPLDAALSKGSHNELPSPPPAKVDDSGFGGFPPPPGGAPWEDQPKAPVNTMPEVPKQAEPKVDDTVYSAPFSSFPEVGVNAPQDSEIKNDELAEQLLTPVQKAAIEYTASNNGMTLEELLKTSLGWEELGVPANIMLESLKYTDAVKVITLGNALNKKHR